MKFQTDQITHEKRASTNVKFQFIYPFYDYYKHLICFIYGFKLDLIESFSNQEINVYQIEFLGTT